MKKSVACKKNMWIREYTEQEKFCISVNFLILNLGFHKILTGTGNERYFLYLFKVT